MLLCFQAISGLKIILDKLEWVRIIGNGDVGMFAKVLGCKAVKLPIKYLGFILGSKYKDLVSWEPVLELFEKRFVGWMQNFFSKGGRLL